MLRASCFCVALCELPWAALMILCFDFAAIIPSSGSSSRGVCPCQAASKWVMELFCPSARTPPTLILLTITIIGSVMRNGTRLLTFTGVLMYLWHGNLYIRGHHPPPSSPDATSQLTQCLHDSRDLLSATERCGINTGRHQHTSPQKCYWIALFTLEAMLGKACKTPVTEFPPEHTCSWTPERTLV